MLLIKRLHGRKKVHGNVGDHWRTDRMLWGRQQAAGTVISPRNEPWWFKFYWLHANSSVGPLVSAGSLFYSSRLAACWGKCCIAVIHTEIRDTSPHVTHGCELTWRSRCRSFWPDVVLPQAASDNMLMHAKKGKTQSVYYCGFMQLSLKHYWSIMSLVEGNSMALVAFEMDRYIN